MAAHEGFRREKEEPVDARGDPAQVPDRQWPPTVERVVVAQSDVEVGKGAATLTWVGDAPSEDRQHVLLVRDAVVMQLGWV